MEYLIGFIGGVLFGVGALMLFLLWTFRPYNK